MTTAPDNSEIRKLNKVILDQCGEGKRKYKKSANYYIPGGDITPNFCDFSQILGCGTSPVEMGFPKIFVSEKKK